MVRPSLRAHVLPRRGHHDAERQDVLALRQLPSTHEARMTALLGRSIRLKKKPSGKVVVERKTTMFLKNKKLKADRAAKAWAELSKRTTT
jgi:hypothetical protein